MRHQRVRSSGLALAVWTAIVAASTPAIATDVARWNVESLLRWQMPRDVALQAERRHDIELRVIREFAPCIKLRVRQPQDWSLRLLEAPVEPGATYIAAVTLSAAASLGQGFTVDIANFRPENRQADAGELSQGNGTGQIIVTPRDEPQRVLASISVTPTTWHTFTLPAFTVPHRVDTVAIRLVGTQGGIYHIADAALASGSNTPMLHRPADTTLPLLFNQQQEEAKSLIEPGREHGIYAPGQTITWRVAPPEAAYDAWTYMVLDAEGNLLEQGQSGGAATIAYDPPDVGYYELVLHSTSSRDASRRMFDVQGAVVWTEAPRLGMGATPFGAQCGTMDLAGLLGASWVRSGLYGWFDEITEIDPAKDESQTIERFVRAGILPMHHTNNIAGKSNSFPPGGVEHLPHDLDAYEQAYATLANLGGGFVQHFEFWNEPEGRLGATEHWTIENFMAAMRAGHRGMKSVSPDAKLTVGSNFDMIKQIIERGGKDDFEIVVLHPYPWPLGGEWNTPEQGRLHEQCIEARRWLDDNGCADKEIWSTEYGYCSGTTRGGVSELEQAQLNVRATLLQLAGGLDKVNPFRLDDVWFWGQVDGRFGFVRQNLTPKPSLMAYGTLIRTLRALPHRGRFDVAPNVAAIVFGNQHETVMAIWTDREDQEVTLSVPRGARHIDLFGRVTPLDQDHATLTVTPSTQYIHAPISYESFSAMQTSPFLAGLHGGIFELSSQGKQWSIPILSVAPRVDGLLDEWHGPAIEMVDANAEFSSQVRTAFQGEYLYLMAQVRGKSPGKNPQRDGNIWDGDCIELYLGTRPDDRPSGMYRDSDFHITVAPGIDGMTGQAANILAGAPPQIPGSVARYRQHEQGGYDLEAAIPLAFFRLEHVTDGQRFGFDIQVCLGNPDAEVLNRRHQATWSGTGQNYLHPYLWGQAVAVTADESAQAEVEKQSTAAPSPPRHLGWTMGVWPTLLHNSSLHTNVIELDDPTWREDFGQGTMRRLFAVTGAWIDNWSTFALHDDQSLTLGGDAPHESAAVIWRFAAPGDKHFNGGVVRATARWLNNASSLEQRDRPSLAVGRQLQLRGGGDYWQGFHGYNDADFQHVAFSPDSSAQQTIDIQVPAGVSEFFVVLTRPSNPLTGTQLRVERLEIEAQFDDPHGLTIRFEPEEPLWSVGDPVLLTINATGDPPPGNCGWSLHRLDGSTYAQGVLPVTEQHTVTLDLTGIDAGMFELRIHDPEKPDRELDRQHLVILRAQDLTITHERSIFGAFDAMSEPEIAKRMGVKWTVQTFQWAWKQPKPDSVVDAESVSTLNGIRKHGFEPIVLIDTSPPWANGGREPTSPPLAEFEDDWQAFHEAAARAMRGHVTWFQSWNEPNNPHALSIEPWTATQAAATAKRLQWLQHRGLKKGNPEAKLIGGCFAGVPADWFTMWLSGLDSVRTHQEAMSAHAYCRSFANENFAHKYPPEPTLVPEIVAARRAMDQHGARHQPLFWTEYGWEMDKVNDMDHARWTARHQVIMNAYREKTRTLADCLFSMQPASKYSMFRSPEAIRGGEHRFRPVIAAYATAASLLAGSSPSSAISDYPRTVRIYSFQRNDHRVYAIWSTEESQAFAARLPVHQARTALRVDLWGEERFERLNAEQPLHTPDNHDPAYLILYDKPHLRSLPHALYAHVDERGRIDDAQIQLANLGPGSMQVRIASDVPWMTPQQSEVTIDSQEPVTIAIQVDAETLSSGMHAATLRIQSSDADDVVVPMRLSVLAAIQSRPKPE